MFQIFRKEWCVCKAIKKNFEADKIGYFYPKYRMRTSVYIMQPYPTELCGRSSTF